MQQTASILLRQWLCICIIKNNYWSLLLAYVRYLDIGNIDHKITDISILVADTDTPMWILVHH
jgi:hypothetical protein